MNVLLWHGYLLRGSGSNVYTANLARQWRAAGHDVLVLCQEKEVSELDFVDEAGDFDTGNTSFSTTPTHAAPAAGRARVVRPAIGELLPVYVYDDYPGFVVKRFVELSPEELQTYTDRNVRALTTAIENFRPDAIITGHEVMGPEIARRACTATGTTYLAKLHGSALEYAVKLQDRYREFARSGLCGARVVVGGSEYMVREASAVVPGWLSRAAVVNPGCDVELFRPTSAASEETPLAGYVGKLIASKGVQNFLTALGLTRTPGLRAVVVGYGGFEAALHDLHEALASGNLERALAVARAGDGKPLSSVVRFLEELPEVEYFGRLSQVPVEFTGRLEHGPLSLLLPTFDVLVVPSVVPEAFGMVAAEAAASGVLPVVPRHSGIGEAGEMLERELGHSGLLTYDASAPVEGVAAALDRVLSIPPGERRTLGLKAAAVARERWSWERVAQRLLELATG